MEKTCPKCSKSFQCEAENDCWCEKVQLHKKDMLILMESYNDCLCPDCLSKYSEK